VVVAQVWWRGGAIGRLVLALLVGVLGIAGRAEAQLGGLVSPGLLSNAHASLEGLRNCAKCHEPGQRVTAERCLACHKPVAERIAVKKGVHRDVGDECVRCHVEHAGRDGELRPFDTGNFRHAAVTGFPLDGKHAPLAARCAACHKTRSYLQASPACSACHVDVHKGRLGANCASCHSTGVAFKDWSKRFDHSKAAFPLVGAHQRVACLTCHVNKVYRGIKFATCTDCHRDPHRASFGQTCTRCHDNDSWRTTRVDHDKTAYPLTGRHVSVACVRCHKQAAMEIKPASARCADCHADVHRGTFRQDCAACHSVAGFTKDAKTAFDHAKTGFPLVDRHAGQPCEACHKRPAAAAVAVRGVRTSVGLDFKGLNAACASCHADVHKGELGPGCETCHSARTFRLKTFSHQGPADFYLGQHESLTCVQCHPSAPLTQTVRSETAVFSVRFKSATTACASCHKDVHLGQVGPDCASCHTVAAAKFAPVGFSHVRSPFPLKGKHQGLACTACHKRETAAFPSGKGQAVRLKGLGTTCQACHADVHAGQLDPACDTCHSTDTFAIGKYTHRNKALGQFFVGAHLTADCHACHKQTGSTAGDGTRRMVTTFQVGTACTLCHTDPHHGGLGDDCIRCHKPLDMAAVTTHSPVLAVRVSSTSPVAAHNAGVSS
jgi:hypothetical protein